MIFYACLISNTGEFKRITFHCPLGSRFDRKTQRCEDQDDEEEDDEIVDDDCEVVADAVEWDNNIFKTLSRDQDDNEIK